MTQTIKKIITNFFSYIRNGSNTVVAALIFCLMFLFSVPVFCDVGSDLNKRKTELSKLQSNISNKKAEKDKLIKEEKKVKLELDKISKAISKNEEELNSLKLKIQTAEKSINEASGEYLRADNEKQKYARSVNEDLKEYLKKSSSSFFDYSLWHKLKTLSIKTGTQKYLEAQNKSNAAKTDIDKYSKSKKNFVSLKKHQQDLMNKNIGIKKNKNRQLKNTTDKRAKAEKEIKELANSKKALEALVKKLTLASNAQRDKTRSLRDKNTKTRKNNLPWPVDGKIVLNYGRSKHPELNTNIVSNGIKIKARDNAVIKAVDEGTVVFTGEFRSYGKIIIIDHKGIFFSVYGQLKKILVKQSQNIARQQDIAETGSGNDSVLYFEIRQYNVPEDPLLWLKPKSSF